MNKNEKKNNNASSSSTKPVTDTDTERENVQDDAVRTPYGKQCFEIALEKLKCKGNRNPHTGIGLSALVSVIPVTFLTIHVGWAALCVFLISRETMVTDWLAVPDSVTTAFGMALVILLAFAVSEATARHRTATEQMYTCAHALRHAVRHALLVYPAGTWMSSTLKPANADEANLNSPDRYRLLAHLAAYPITLVLTLTRVHGDRNDAARTQVITILKTLLNDHDLKYVLAAPQPHLRCSAVARSYFTAADEGSVRNYSRIASSNPPAGNNARFHAVTLVDAIDIAAATVTRIARFRPAKGYRILLRVFTVVWTAFVPLSILGRPDTRWFTLLWSFLVTYSVSTILAVATALDNSFSTAKSSFLLSFRSNATVTTRNPNTIGVPVLLLCTGFAADVLTDVLVSPSYSSTLPSSEDAESGIDLMKSDDGDVAPVKSDSGHAHGWLKSSLPHEAAGYSNRRVTTPRIRAGAILRAIFRPPRSVVVALVVFTLWSAVVVFLTWGLSQRLDTPRGSGVRWWSAQVPLSTTTLGYIGTAMFLLLSFWTTDAFARYFRSLQLWRVTTRTNLEAFAHIIVLVLRPGYWHFRDHERLLSYVAALPVTMKLHLRGSRNISELQALVGHVDAQRFVNDPRPFPVHCMDVLHSYVNAADSAVERFVNEDERPFLTTGFTLQNALWNADRALWECVALNNAPIPPSFTLHLKIFVGIWLTLLPTVVVQQSGFVSFVFLLPIAYSVINLVYTADRIRDPFGCDEEDLPLDALCEDIRDSIHRIFLETKVRQNVIPLDEQYRREDFQPKRENYFESMNLQKDNDVDDAKGLSFATPKKLASSWRQMFRGFSVSPLMVDDLPVVREHQVRLTFFGAVRKQLKRFPTISFRAYILATLWSVAAVYMSWGLSELWEGQDRGDCRVWCSPIDVQGSVLANIGFALFLITSFRAADALQRFDLAANLLFEVARRTRGLVVEFAHVFPSDFFHSGVKERVVAHVVQIPLCLHEMLHNGGLGRESANHGLLSSTDRQRFVSSSSPMEHLLETVQAYIAVQDSTKREGWELDEFRASPSMAGSLFAHIAGLRTIVAQTTTLKQFSEVESYSKLERTFTIIWLGLLPLSLAPDLGFFTILWSPLISYGVLAVQDFAAQLADPFGCDAGDLPLRALSAQAVNTALDAINSAGWDTERLCAPPPDLAPSADSCGLGASLQDARVYPKIYPPSLDDKESSQDADPSVSSRFAIHALPRPHASFFAHIRCSIPWRGVFLSFLWALAVCTIEKVTMARDEQTTNATFRWWSSTVQITVSVVNGASFGAFLLLGFFATTAFARYDRGGALWEARIRPACHQLVSTLRIYVHEGIVHEGDVNRLIGLVAAFPLLLKAELRDVRDLRDVSCLLTSNDLARIAYAENMSMYCLDTIRAYVIRVVSHKDLLLSEEPVPPRGRTGFVRTALAILEEAVQEAKFLKTFGVSPVFRILLKTLLTIFLILVPFILYLRSGWFTLIWTPMIAYGVLGTYAIAVELQQPFGGDLNDIDVDEISQSIVEDVLKVNNDQQTHYTLLTDYAEPPASWLETRAAKVNLQEHPQPIAGSSRGKSFLRGIRLAWNAVPLWQLIALSLWSLLMVVLAKVLVHLDLERCENQRFCQFAIIDEDIKDYVGFSVFFLLGFLVNTAHGRYVMAQTLWNENIIGTTHLLTHRILHTLAPGSFHPGDVERICGHIAAMPIVLAAELRHGEQLTEQLQNVVGSVDARNITSAKEPAAHCLDVARAYLFYAETLGTEQPDQKNIGDQELFNCLLYIDELQEAIFECRRIARVRVPFGYISHVRLYLTIWLALLPIGIVEDSGWFTILWVVLVGYGLLGALHWAAELTNPFGCKDGLVTLDSFRDQAIQAVENNLPQFSHGAISLVSEDDHTSSSSSKN